MVCQKEVLQIFLFLFCWYHTSAQLPAEFSDQLVSSEFEYPMGLVADENGQMYVWEKQGRIFVMDTEGNKVQEPLVDLREEIGDWQDHGLNCVALHPNFLDNGFFYMLYVVERNFWLNYGSPTYHPDTTIIKEATFARVTRYTADPNSNFTSIVDGSRKVIVGMEPEDGLPILNQFHGVGTILVGSDETLLISLGDGTRSYTSDGKGGDKDSYTHQAIADGIITADQAVNQYKALYIGSLNGKILRVDSETGAGLPSNPYYDSNSPRAPQSRVWASGFRNPYRIALRPETGSHFSGDGQPGIIFAGDVGNAQWEELNVVTEGGQNFGWPIIEGIYLNWGFVNSNPPANQMAPNPLYGTGGCEEEFFDFKELFFRALPEGKTHTFPNPCDPSYAMPPEVFPQVETLPTIQWSHAEWNLPARAETPYFNEEDRPRGRGIGEPDSDVAGGPFNGFSSLSGTFYSGDAFPEEFHGSFFGFDFSGWIKKFDFDENHKLLSVEPFYDDVKKVIHLTENASEGCLYFVNQQNEIRKICYGGNPRPVSIAHANINYGASPLNVAFDGSESYDVFGDPITFHWDFGDGQTSNEEKPNHTFNAQNANPESFTVLLTVKDSAGATGTSEIIISLNNTPPEVIITSFNDGDRYPTHRTSLLVLEAKVEDQEHDYESLTHQWQVFTHHNNHFHPSPKKEEAKTYTLISPLGCGEENYWYRIELKVTDPEGLSTLVNQEIFPNCDEDFVEFVSISNEYSRTAIPLKFVTLFENTVSHFEVQRSSDYLNFESIGVLRPIGISPTSVDYNFTDHNPNIGSNIYRIKAISPSGAFEFSPMLPVSFPQEADVALLPNPTDGELHIKLKESSAEDLSLDLFTANGVLIFERSWEVTKGEKFTDIILLNHLVSGLYFYRVVNGDEESVGKLYVK